VTLVGVSRVASTRQVALYFLSSISRSQRT
jgi:hypothetical protein